MRAWTKFRGSLGGGIAATLLATGCGGAKSQPSCGSGASCSAVQGDDAAEQPVLLQPAPASAGTSAEAGADASVGRIVVTTSDAGEDVAQVPATASDGGGSDAPSEAAASVPESGAEAEALALTCAASELACSGVCVPSDVRNCGTCGTPCTTTVANAAATCTGGACGYACGAGFSACGAACTNLADDAVNCGACGRACTGNTICVSGTCVCPSGTHVCAGTCLSNTSVASCGTTACTACPVPTDGTATCDGTACGISCDAGYLSCGGACVDETKNGNCGGCGNTCGVSCASAACVNVSAIAAGFDFTCALLSDGTVECWGNNNFGQLGAPVAPQLCGSNPCSPSPVVVPGVSGAKAIGAGAYHACAVLADGTVTCWGANTSGQTGALPSDAGTGTSPARVPGVTNAVSVSGGTYSTCALLGDGAVECWGANSTGQLGAGSITTTSGPTEVVSPNGSGYLSQVMSVTVGSLHACAAYGTGGVVCWGNDDVDQLGATPAPADDGGVPDYSATPLPVSGLTHANVVAAGSSDFTCALSGSTVSCWGYLLNGLGDAANTQQSATPVTVETAGDAPVSAVSVGGLGACIIYSGWEDVACWGQVPLGNGTNATSTSPAGVPNMTGATAVAVGANHVCVLLTGGTGGTGGSVSCWGTNDNGQLGNGTTADRLQPTPVIWGP